MHLQIRFRCYTDFCDPPKSVTQGGVFFFLIQPLSIFNLISRVMESEHTPPHPLVRTLSTQSSRCDCVRSCSYRVHFALKKKKCLSDDIIHLHSYSGDSRILVLKKAKEKRFNGTISLRSLLFQTRLQIEVSLVTLSPSELLTSRTWLSALDKLHPITPGEFG